MNRKMVKVYRTVRISDKLVQTVERFLKTNKAQRLGLETIKDVIEYYTRKGLEK